LLFPIKHEMYVVWARRKSDRIQKYNPSSIRRSFKQEDHSVALPHDICMVPELLKHQTMCL